MCRGLAEGRAGRLNFSEDGILDRDGTRVGTNLSGRGFSVPMMKKKFFRGGCAVTYTYIQTTVLI